ncbi:histidine N-acetyltransferase-like [Silurus meridionalis]|uniref:histidine N-acetyltransferase-like n=1 Tax=Silurus meridionalis TaxID=175797 RepID=UPI001EEA67B9|nr:histidine N-acetyltransferase-like [Silurus meridionalis]
MASVTCLVQHGETQLQMGQQKEKRTKAMAILSLFGEAESFKGFVTDQKAKLESIKKSNKPDNNQKLFVLKDNHQLNAILLDPKLSLRLQLPGGAIIQNWQPLKLMESNLEIMKKQNLTWMFDWFEDKPMFMSFHTPPYPVPLQGGSLILNIDMFGTDVSIARNALIAHLEQVLEEIHGNVVIHIYMPQTFWESMRQFCDGHEGVKQYMYYGEQWLLEKDMS